MFLKMMLYVNNGRKKAIIIRRKRGNGFITFGQKEEGYFRTIDITPIIFNSVPKKVICMQSQVLSNLTVFSRLGNIP